LFLDIIMTLLRTGVRAGGAGSAILGRCLHSTSAIAGRTADHSPSRLIDAGIGQERALRLCFFQL
jgi:hypothetical protein